MVVLKSAMALSYSRLSNHPLYAALEGRSMIRIEPDGLGIIGDCPS